MKKNKQLDLYFDEIQTNEKEHKYLELRSNIVISAFLIIFLIISLRLVFLGLKKIFIYIQKIMNNYFMKEEM